MCEMKLQFSWVWTEFPEQNSQLQGTSISFATLKYWNILEIMLFNSQVMSVLRLSDMCHEWLRIVHKESRQRGEKLSLRQQPRSDPWQPHCILVFFAQAGMDTHHLPSNWKIKSVCVCTCHLSCTFHAVPLHGNLSEFSSLWSLGSLHVTCSTIHGSMSILCLCASRCVPWSWNRCPIYLEDLGGS